MSRDTDDLILTCECGCVTFYVHRDGRIVCPVCMIPMKNQPKAGWTDDLPPDLRRVDKQPFTDLHGQDEAFGRRRIAQMAARDDAVAVVVLTQESAFHWAAGETFKDANDTHDRLVGVAKIMLARVDEWAKNVMSDIRAKVDPDPVLRVIDGLGLGGGKGHVVDHDSVVLGHSGGSGGGGRDGSCMDRGDSRQSSHDSGYSSDTGGGSDSSGGSSCD